MNKAEFLDKLQTNLKRSHVVDINRYLQDYRELIADESEARSVSEDQVVNGLDDPKTIVRNIMTEDHPKTHFPTAWLVLLILALVIGSPLWCSLLLLGIILILLGYLLVWLIPAGLIVFSLSALVIGAYGLPAGIVSLFKVGVAIGTAELGTSLIGFSLALLVGAISWWSIKYFSIASIAFSKWLISKFKEAY
ncbi:HAAS domain-containing protein [Lentilactobacillus kisonensis]|uniref:DUF1700 domain-containing protein n=1 Tax=Lentilactobacillus kisonensis F0435 TaxID=797516 RepID=H1LI78_9LACO|nr:DUF1700 domain-containing protein [Lentilactobacillus kisonensis]EHO49911.1 hypothetical protein HMPREF9104_02319 [Lentilactobacillus kisonensis F0435]